MSENWIFEKYFPFSIGKIQKVIGEGAFGCVIYGTNEYDNKEKALVKITRIENEEEQNDFQRELEIHDALNALTPIHVPDFKGVDYCASLPIRFHQKLSKSCSKLMKKWKKKKFKGNFYFIAMSLGNQGSLRNLLTDSSRKLTLDRLRSIIFQLLYANCLFSSKLNFVHKDMKPENVVSCSLDWLLVQRPFLKKSLIGYEKDKCFQWKYQWNQHAAKYVPMYEVVQLIDFGFSEFLDEKSEFDDAGTPGYVSPDTYILTSTRSLRTDMWSLAIILIEMALTNAPEILKQEIFAGHEHFTDSLLNIIIREDKFKLFRNKFKHVNVTNVWACLILSTFLSCMVGHSLKIQGKVVENHSLLNKTGLVFISHSWDLLIHSLWQKHHVLFEHLNQFLKETLSSHGYEFLSQLLDWNFYREKAPFDFLLDHDFFGVYKTYFQASILDGKPKE